MAYTTKAPTGLQVERNGNEFTFSWKIKDADHGKKQEFQFRISDSDKWRARAVTVKQTSITIEYDASKVKEMSFRVRGQRKEFTKKVDTGKKDKKGNPITKNKNVKPLISAWKTKSGWTPTKPSAPEVSYERTTANSGTFTVEHRADTDGSAIARYVQYETCVSTSSANPPKSGWTTVTNLNGLVDVNEEISYTEETEKIRKVGQVRWFRARCAGPGGNSKWIYEHHAYSKPEDPALKGAKAKKIVGRAETVLTANWQSKTSLLRPIDEEIIQYVIAVPDNTACNAPASGWVDAMSVSPSGKKDIVSATVSDMSTTDQCLWMRIAAVHDDDYLAYSKAMLVTKEALAKPGINANPNFSTGSVSITLTINTDCSVARHLIFYRDPKRPKADIPVAILAPGVTTTTVNVPAIKGASKSCFGAYAFVGTYSGLTPNAIMKSASALDEDIAAVEPDPLTLEGYTTNNGSAFVGFTWKWSGATSIELSWSDSALAWQSNVEPKSYTVTDTGATWWYLQDLGIGKILYFRARYHGFIDEDEVTSAWSEISMLELATNPEKPTLRLSSGFVLPGGSVSASWDYVNEDESPQSSGQICLADVSPSLISYGSPIAHSGSAQSVSVSHKWTVGQTYYLCCRVRAESDLYSDWSNPVSVYCPAKPSIEFVNTAIVNNVLSSLDGTIGIGVSADNCVGDYSLSIIRAADYHCDRPDDGVYDGYKDETIWTQSGHYTGAAQVYSFTINPDDLIGALDDGARYYLVGTITDAYGQTVTRRMSFKVNWAHKSGINVPAVSVDRRLMCVRVTPRKPAGWIAGDTFDIYRITADQPELIVKDGEYGVTYVDPYPGFGQLCGHRVVMKTATGSYITEDDSLAWVDLGIDDGDIIESNSIVIDANGMQIRLPYNIELTNKWQKDFKRTSYLGGSVQGDWNPAVLRDLTAETVIVKDQDTDELMDLRDLAAYAGPAHIRTPDGSSFACDIQITEDASYNNKTVRYSLTVKGIDPEEPEGMTLAEWRALHPVGG